MKLNLKKIIIITLVICWMILIFYLSNQISQHSEELSSGVTKIILKILNILELKTPEQILAIDAVIRKLAHFFIYTLGGMLILMFINLYKIKASKKVLISWLIGTCYAITDEIHQLFVPGRGAEIMDVCIDSLGVITGIIILLLIFKLTNRLKTNKIDKNEKEKIN